MIFFSTSLSKKNKVYPTQKQISPSCWKENLWYSFQQVRRKNVCQGCTNLSTNFVNKNFYIQICGLSIESVTKICQTNMYNLSTKSVQNLSLKSVHKFCQQDQQICQQLSLISSKVYILSAGICPQKNPRICTQFVTILETICHYSAFRSSQIHFVLSRIMSVHTSTVNLEIMVKIYFPEFLQKINLKH